MKDEIILTSDYWDCECEAEYIHSKEESFCKYCKSYADEQPDARADEVKQFLESEYNNVIYQIDVVDCFGRYEIAQLLKITEEVKKLNILLSKSPKATNNIA